MGSLSISIVTYYPDPVLFHALLDTLNQSVRTLCGHRSDIIPCLSIHDNSENKEAYQSIVKALDDTWEFASIPVTEAPTNLGFGAGHNQCLNNITSSYHLILNPDVRLEKDALIAAFDYMENNPDVGLLTPHVTGTSGVQLFLCKRYPSIFDLFLRGFAPRVLRNWFRNRLDRYELRDITTDKPAKGIPICSGCFMFLRTPLLKELGGFSPRYFMYFEDFDLCMRMRGRADIAYVPSVRITHAGGDAAKKGGRHIALFSTSAWRFFSRWGWHWI